MDNHLSFDLSKAAKVCAKAFFKDELDRYFFPNETTRLYHQERMYKYFLSTNLNNISVTSKELEGLMVLEKSGSYKTKLTGSDILGGLSLFKLGLGTIARMIIFQSHALTIRNRLIKAPYWYLSLIVVAPEYQGKGFASKLLKSAIAKADEAQKHIFLETHNPKNLPLYEKFGFRLLDSIILEPSHLWHYCMTR